MQANPKISLCIANSEKPGRHLSVRIKQNISNEPSEYSRTKSVFVVSDIQANFKGFCQLLYKVKIIDRHFRWVFGDNHLVIAGDCFDGSKEVSECLWLIYSLEEKAKNEGGYVHLILGDNEIMNINGDWRYIHPKYAEKRPGSRNPATALYDGSNELWRWLLTKNVVEKIGGILFVHSGISQELLKLKPSVKEINNTARPFYKYVGETFADPLLNTLLHGENSPFLYRGYYQSTAIEELIDATLAHFKVHTIVTGHTMVEKISSFFDGKVINVNTDHANGKSEGLLIKKHRFYRISMKEKRERIK